ncbi:Dual specificity tyrosine-phosphorylation-regulated kinase 3 [Tritrichomonas foetus]|uniref:dual-specificity kinase n=1 Tax=Tritrichomonas foetus TaxID=1144522 RepID=A0A1J4K1L6_9EUKA|nr:Dual specificity tyrosine-phosphorylation-regulated kinase 3 [Tritrichomonas foetus]|eukprot:OHT05131.1 Dual specificity tyrosine-phosphorylation-regulated kinase 3 [Tritrichomonas foetus]
MESELKHHFHSKTFAKSFTTDFKMLSDLPTSARTNPISLPALDVPVAIKLPQTPRMCTCRRNVHSKRSPIIDDGPLTPSEAIKNYSSFLMPYETKEIQKFHSIYFVGYPDAKLSSGYDSKFQYKINPRDHIAYRYEVIKILGGGSFGQVVEAFDHKKKRKVAIKILINVEDVKDVSKNEADILAALNKNHCSNVIKGIDYFIFRSHACITFELLGPNLYQYWARHSFRAMKPNLVKDYAIQIFKALKDCSKLGIIHCDIKPENICQRLDDPSKIKIVDFGSACFDKKRIYTYIQSRYYRSPEVILGMSYGCGIDVWSVGVMIVEFLSGRTLFPGRNELDMLNLIAEVLGPPPKYLIKTSKKKYNFFHEDGTLKASFSSKPERAKKRTLEQILGDAANPILLDFLKKCLTWDPLARITAAQALKHPWLNFDPKDNRTVSQSIIVRSKDTESLPSLSKYSQIAD